jgi:hypothetical protein
MSIIEKDKKYVANTYARFPVEIVSGQGSYLYSPNGKKYIDMGSGIGVTAFGFNDEQWKSAVIGQINKVQHTSNLYYTEPCARLAELLCEKSGMKKVFFANSGAEANECAIKVARKYAADKKGNEYNTKHIDKAMKDSSIVLFGSYPFDIDKKTVMMNMVNEMYSDNPIEWVLNKNNELKKENYDACDSLICTLAYININHNGLDKPVITKYSKKETNETVEYSYTTKVWDREYDKILILKK